MEKLQALHLTAFIFHALENLAACTADTWKGRGHRVIGRWITAILGGTLVLWGC